MILEFIFNFFIIIGVWYEINVVFYVIFNIFLQLIYKQKLEFSEGTSFTDRVDFSFNSIFKLYRYCKYNENEI